MFFEGSEKKLEIVVSDKISLRSWDTSVFEDILSVSGCKKISEMKNDFCTSYVLSESSLFVWDHRLILITCGRTKLIQGALEFLKHCSSSDILSFIYQRKNEHFPYFQNTYFFQDNKVINEQIKGTSYLLGKTDGHHLFLFHQDKNYLPEKDDSTLEVLMNEVPQETRDVFKSENKTKLKEFLNFKELEGFKWDDYYFKPEGYSLNAIKDQFYFTIHVTPEDLGCYISFETNCPFNDTRSFVKELTTRFKPESFSSVIFSTDSKLNSSQKLEPFVRSHFSLKKLSCGYTISYESYVLPQDEPKKPYLIPKEI